MVPDPDPEGPSWGNISERHWSRSRKDANQEALEYYRERSRAPGVAAGGAERNFYCMACDGVIPYDALSGGATACPHCGEELDEKVRRYFNWVEIDQPGEGDARAMLPLLLGGLLVLALLIALVVTLL